MVFVPRPLRPALYDELTTRAVNSLLPSWDIPPGHLTLSSKIKYALKWCSWRWNRKCMNKDSTFRIAESDCRKNGRESDSSLEYCKSSTIRYDTTRDAILTFAWKPTRVSLICRTEPTTKKWKTEKLKSQKTDMLRSFSKQSRECR